MPRKPRQPLPFVEKMRKLSAAALDSRACSDGQPSAASLSADDRLDDLPTRIRRILGLADQTTHTRGHMLFFVMYDIESNKVRRLVSRYLQEKGCSRIQRSIFLASTTTAVYN